MKKFRARLSRQPLRPSVDHFDSLLGIFRVFFLKNSASHVISKRGNRVIGSHNHTHNNWVGIYQQQFSFTCHSKRMLTNKA